MEVKAVQFNVNTKSNEHKHYLEVEGPVDTKGLVKPLPGKGHLIHDDVISAPVYFVKDIAYDIKSLKNGIKGTANDHQLGRLNDVGLQVGGVGIATYLASQTTNPKARIMEYVGLAAFLTAMNIYPKIAINMPSRLMHGYDIGKWYIDDQGRKKSVNQDSNYRPMDLYRGDVKGETLDEIGDKMGIPRNIKNRHEIIKEQTRKNATQSQTLWMLTAGFATPVLAALGCYGLENYVISPQLEKARNKKHDNLISQILDKTQTMELNTEKIGENDLSARVGKILSKYKGQELPKEELDRVLEMLVSGVHEGASAAIREEVANVIKDGFVLNGEVTEKMLEGTKKLFDGEDLIEFKEIFPSRAEIQETIKKVVKDVDFTAGGLAKEEDISAVKKAIRELIQEKINLSALEECDKDFLTQSKLSEMADKMIQVMRENKAKIITDESIASFTNLAKILGEFKENIKVIDKCSAFKFEHAPETELARFYAKFEKTLIKELGFSPKEMKKMRESKEYTLEALNKKLSELCKDENRYKKTFDKLCKIISEMEVALNGSSEDGSKILDLINAMENNYNNTARRLHNLGGFDKTVFELVKQDVSSLGNSIKSRKELFDYLDGIVENKYKMGITGSVEEYARYNANGVASAKNLDVTRILERYQGVKNSFNRILHTFEVFKRTASPEEFLRTLDGLTGEHISLSRRDMEYINAIIKKGREAILTASSADFNLKLDLVNNPQFFIDVMNSIWAPEKAPKDSIWSTKARGYVTDIARDSMNSYNDISKGNLLDRFQWYITRFRNVVANSTIDFTKPHHLTNPHVRNSYTKSELTNMSFFNLVAQSPADMLQGGVKREYGTQKWFKTVSAVAAGVFGVTLLAQAGFGRIKNPHNIKKQVNNEANK